MQPPQFWRSHRRGAQATGYYVRCATAAKAGMPAVAALLSPIFLKLAKHLEPAEVRVTDQNFDRRELPGEGSFSMAQKVPIFLTASMKSPN